jgi:hypothetical protein
MSCNRPVIRKILSRNFTLLSSSLNTLNTDSFIVVLHHCFRKLIPKFFGETFGGFFSLVEKISLQ